MAAAGTIAATAKAKKGVTYTSEDVDRFLDGFQMLQCCGIQEYEGTRHIKSASDAKAIRAAAWFSSYDDGIFFNKDGGSGYVIISAVGDERKRLFPFMRPAGFKLLSRFNNGRTGNDIDLWGAKTLQRGPKPTDWEESKENT